MTTSMLTNDAVLHSKRAIHTNMNKAAKAMHSVASGSRLAVEHDPSAQCMHAKLSTSIGSLEQCKRNLQQSGGLINVVNSSLENVRSILQKGKTLLAQMNNEMLSPKSRNLILTEFNALFGADKSRGVLYEILSQIKIDDKSILMSNNAVQLPVQEEYTFLNEGEISPSTINLDSVTASVGNIGGAIRDVRVTPQGEKIQVQIFLDGNRSLIADDVELVAGGEIKLYLQRTDGEKDMSSYLLINFAEDISGLEGSSLADSAYNLREALKSTLGIYNDKSCIIKPKSDNFDGISLEVGDNCTGSYISVQYDNASNRLVINQDGKVYTSLFLPENTAFSQYFDEIDVTLRISQVGLENLKTAGEDKITNFSLINSEESRIMQIGENPSVDIISWSWPTLKHETGNLYNILMKEDGRSLVQKVNDASAMIDSVLDKVNTLYSRFGTLNNKMDIMKDSIDSHLDSLHIAAGAINDADISQGITDAVRFQVLTQAAMAMLAQANSQTQMYLKIMA